MIMDLNVTKALYLSLRDIISLTKIGLVRLKLVVVGKLYVN